MEPEKKNNFAVPIAIIIAGAFVAGAIFYSNNNATTTPQPTDIKGAEIAIEVPEVTSADHLLGNPNASVVMIEYSDTECPFCKNFHATMNQIMDAYGKNGKVAWIYRHFPLDQIHSKARKEAEGAECAAELGGNDKFWAYMDRIFEITPSNDGLDLKLVPQIAVDIGLDKTAFEQCLNSGKYASRIESDFQGGVKAGVRGTPNTVFVFKKPLSKEAQGTLTAYFSKYPSNQQILGITKEGSMVQISGALPHADIKTIIDTALAQ